MSSKNKKSKSKYWDSFEDNYEEHDDYGYGYGYGSYGAIHGAVGSKNHGAHTRYTWSPAKWSTLSWNTGYGSDDNSKLFVKDPITYETPTSREIKNKTCLWVEKAIDEIKNLARLCYFKMIDEHDYISEAYADLVNLPEEETNEYKSKKELYDQVFDTYIPGFTPLEQAIAIYRQMEQDNANDGGEFIDNPDARKISLYFNRELYSDATINEQLDFNELSKDRKMDIFNKMSIVGDLGHQFKVEKEIQEKIVSNSDTSAKKIMRDYSQFSNVELYQKLFPNFRSKFLTKDLIVNIPVERKEQKQMIIVLLDFSGSMSEDEKQIWVNAIMIDRLKYVMKGEAEVFFSYFVHKTEQLHFQHIKDSNDVMKFWQTFSNDPNRGTKNIGGIVKDIAKYFNKEKKLHNLDIDLSEQKPEILIINDGEDSIGYDSFPYKVNAISLFNCNDELKKLCINAKGKYVYVDDNNSVTTWSADGEQKLS